MAKKRTSAELEKLIAHHMATLKCTREEALDVIACDDAIDGGNKALFAPTAEEKKNVRALLKAEKDPTKKRTVNRERKIDEDKKTVFEWLKVPLEGFALNGTIEGLTCKHEAEISFTYNGNAYTLKVTKHRPQK